MKLLFDQLVDLHNSIDAHTILGFIENDLVKDPTTGTPLWKSYVPFVGPLYEPGGLLLVGTAQSLAKIARRGEESEWQMATGLPKFPLHRLYRVGKLTVERPLTTSEVSFKSIAIQPYMDGILAGIAGAALAALGWGIHETLDAVTQRIAVTNFFKHSLWTPKRTDLNPLKLTDKRYRQFTLQQYVLKEIEILRPRVVVVFNRAIAHELSQSWDGGHVYGINDPAWIKRGGSFRQQPELEVEKARLLSGYVKQMEPPYGNGKAAAARTFLGKYYSDFAANRLT